MGASFSYANEGVAAALSVRLTKQERSGVDLGMDQLDAWIQSPWLEDSEDFAYDFDEIISHVSFSRVVVSSASSGVKTATRSQKSSLNNASHRPEWAPLCVPADYLAQYTYQTALETIRLEGNFANQGIGREIVNTVQQSLASNTLLENQEYFIRTCHMPIFMAVDSHYGYLITKNVPAKTSPSQIFPWYWILGGDPDRESKEAKNREAMYRYTDLYWSTPLSWAIARMDLFQNKLDPKGIIQWFSVIIGLSNGISSGFATIYKSDHPGTFDMDAREADFETYYFKLGATSITFKLVAHTAKVICDDGGVMGQKIDQHCRSLGNRDRQTTGAIILTLQTLQFSPQTPGPVQVAVWMQLLAFLVDTCRVFYRPLVLSSELATFLCHLADKETLEELFIDPRMPAPAPHFIAIPGDRIIWIPVKKPRSTDATGTRIIPLPKYEPMPMIPGVAFEAVDETPEVERPTKRARTECLTCGVPVTSDHHEATMAFCTARCVHDYYHDAPY